MKWPLPILVSYPPDLACEHCGGTTIRYCEAYGGNGIDEPQNWYCYYECATCKNVWDVKTQELRDKMQHPERTKSST